MKTTTQLTPTNQEDLLLVDNLLWRLRCVQRELDEIIKLIKERIDNEQPKIPVPSII